MKKETFKILAKNDCEEIEKSILSDYWNFSDVSNRKFTYTAKEILIKYNIKSSDKLNKIVKKTGYLVCEKLLDCGKCSKDFKILLRSNISFDRWFKTDKTLTCIDCKNDLIKNEIIELLDSFKKIYNEVEEIEIKEPTHSLSYLENIFLYVLLTSDQNKYSIVIKQSVWNSFKEVEANGIEHIVKGIIDKGYIYKTKEYLSGIKAQNKLRSFNLFHNSLIEKTSKDKVENYLRANFDSQILFNMPKEYKNIEDWIENLFIKIQNYVLDLSDLKQLEKFVLNKRLKEVYALVGLICEKRNIPIKKNNAFEHNLVRMIKKYDLQHIYNLLLYQANMTASKLYDLSNSSESNSNFIKETIYANKIASYLDKLERDNEKPKYPQILPENWTYSGVELFVSAHIIGNYEKWEKFTINEILALWSDSVEINMNDK